MIAATRSERAAGAFAISMFAASLGFGIGLAGPLGFLIFPMFLVFMVLFAGPGAALGAWILAVYMEPRAATAATRGELWRVGLLIGLPIGLLNVAPAYGLLVLSHLGIRDMDIGVRPLPYLLGALWGGLGLVHGTLDELKPGRTP
jgi:hypothetical protein